MRILMLGNSFTTANHMPDMLAELTGAEIVQHTRGGERLADQLNPKTKMESVHRKLCKMKNGILSFYRK